MGSSCPSPISIQGSVCSSLKSRLLLSFVLEKAPFLVVAFFAPFDMYTSHITPLAQFLALGDIAEGHGVPKAPVSPRPREVWQEAMDGDYSLVWKRESHQDTAVLLGWDPHPLSTGPWLLSSPQAILDAALLRPHAHSNELSPSPCTPVRHMPWAEAAPQGFSTPR